MRETGRIREIKGSRAVVELSFTGGCASCSLSGICKTDGAGRRQLDLDAGQLSLEPGDSVEIETAPRSLLTAAFLVFIFPLALSFIAYMLVTRLGGSGGLALAGFFAAFALALLTVSFIDRKAGRGRFFEPKIIRRI
ncbi:SoxR reducing system RseC family protein [bacterium]|nr:SoxR reducing system RseC family protein [bacterium]